MLIQAVHLLDRITPQQKIHVQTSGRWSTTDPPLTQMPERIRDVVCADPGFPWVKYDFDQIEPRLNAALSGDKASLECFANNWDYHTLNTCDFLELTRPGDLVDPHRGAAAQEWRDKYGWMGKGDIRRKFGKQFALRLDYGGEPKSAGDVPGAKQMGLGADALTRSANAFLMAHPEKARYRAYLKELAARVRIVRTFLGRRRLLHGEAREIIREAFNHPLQGGVTDIFNLLLIYIRATVPHIRWVIGCHDSMTWRIPEAYFEQAVIHIYEILQTPWPIRDMTGTSRWVVFPATFDKGYGYEVLKARGWA